MDREQEDVEPGDSLAEMREPAINAFQKPSDVPRDSEAWRTMVEADPDRRENVAAQKKAKDALAKLAAARSTKPSRENDEQAAPSRPGRASSECACSQAREIGGCGRG